MKLNLKAIVPCEVLEVPVIFPLTPPDIRDDIAVVTSPAHSLLFECCHSKAVTTPEVAMFLQQTLLVFSP